MPTDDRFYDIRDAYIYVYCTDIEKNKMPIYDISTHWETSQRAPYYE